MGGWVDERANEQADTWMDGQMDGQAGEWMDGHMDECVRGLVCRYSGRWMSG